MIRRLRRCCLVLCGALAAQPLPADEGLVTFRSLAPESALQVAQAALASCREAGFQTGVAVVDRAGVLQVFLRDQLAGPHTLDGAARKAFTAASFRQDTLTLAAAAAEGTPFFGIREVEQVLLLGGGIPISVSGSVVGGVGVAGANTPEADHACAQAGIDAVSASLELAAED